jgi:hypothetical protein
MHKPKRYKTLADPTAYPLGSMHPIDGHTWRVIHVAPLEDAIDEAAIMTLRGPTFYRAELERVD